MPNCRWADDTDEGVIYCEAEATCRDPLWVWLCAKHAAENALESARFERNRASEIVERAQLCFDDIHEEPIGDRWTAALAAPRYVRWDSVLSKN